MPHVSAQAVPTPIPAGAGQVRVMADMTDVEVRRNWPELVLKFNPVSVAAVRRLAVTLPGHGTFPWQTRGREVDVRGVRAHSARSRRPSSRWTLAARPALAR